MKKQLVPLAILIAIAVAANLAPNSEPKKPTEAGAALQLWAGSRLFPDGTFQTEKYSQALTAMRLAAQLRGERSTAWEDLGPKNIGGRTLCLAVHPLDTNILWMGSASGGIWKSTTAGRGAAAWQRVETGFPVLGVSSVAIDPVNPDIMYAGTGEVYNRDNSLPSIAVRTTRGTYGIGILKSTDGGQSWQKCLDWSYGDLRAVQDIKINPLRPATLYAATTEGVLRSYDAGANWQTVSDVPMAVDLEINPSDTSKIYVSHGSLDNNAISGIYRSQNSGDSFTKMTSGLPASFSGKALLTISPSNPDILYVTVGNVLQQVGMYKTTNGGNSWTLANSTDVCKHQGWYSHDIAVHPTDPNTFVWAGFDTWKSSNGGASVQQKSYWYLWDFGYVPAGGPEGPPDYVHADIHRVYYETSDPEKVYLVTDGGLFVSLDGGETYEGRNGGYQTQQFYANLGNSSSSSDLAIGGMQDNATAIYFGDPSWTRVLGGDGLCAAIRPGNDQIIYGSIQYLAMNKSTDGGQSWYGIGNEINEDAAFNGPFELAPSNPDVMYAGAQNLWRSGNAGESWFRVTTSTPDLGNYILTIAINPNDPDEVYFSTYPNSTDQAKVFKFSANTGIAEEINGLPNRYCMDINWHPTNPNIAYAVFGGFNTEHVWRTLDGGQTWSAIDNGLPDLPTNTLLIDPLYPDVLYVGNDLGVWVSANAGASWEPYSTEAPQALLVMHLSMEPQTRKLRAATYGLGLWQTDMLTPSQIKTPVAGIQIQSISPNPAGDRAVLNFYLADAGNVQVEMYDMQGKLVWQTETERLPVGNHRRELSLGSLPAGTYGVSIVGTRGRQGTLLVKK